MKYTVLWAVAIVSITLQGCLAEQMQNVQRAQTFYTIGVKQSNLGQFREALASLKRAEEFDPDNYWIQEALGGTLLRMGQASLALKHYKKALDNQPKSPRGWNNLGTVHMALEQWSDAIKAFKKALGNMLYQTPCLAYINIAWCYHKISNPQESDKYFNLAIDTCPRMCQGHRLRGMAAYERKQYDQAAQSFQHLTSYCKDFLPGYYQLGLAHVALRQFEKARKALTHCVEHSDKLPAVQQSCRQLAQNLPKPVESSAPSSSPPTESSDIYIKPHRDSNPTP